MGVPGYKHHRGTVQTCVCAYFACTVTLNVPSLLRFTHSSSTLNESANHPMHWTSQTILYLSSGYRRENNDSLTQVKKGVWLNQYFYSAALILNPLFKSKEANSGVWLCHWGLLLICQIQSCPFIILFSQSL